MACGDEATRRGKLVGRGGRGGACRLFESCTAHGRHSGHLIRRGGRHRTRALSLLPLLLHLLLLRLLLLHLLLLHLLLLHLLLLHLLLLHLGCA